LYCDVAYLLYNYIADAVKDLPRNSKKLLETTGKLNIAGLLLAPAHVGFRFRVELSKVPLLASAARTATKEMVI
jgi:hypothetical protein